MRILRHFLIVILFSLLIGIALFPAKILLACVKYKAIHFFEKELDASLTFDTFKWEEGHIVCRGGVVEKGEELKATFSEATLTPTLNWKQREIEGALEIKGLRIINRKTKPISLPTPSSPSLALFSLNLTTTIQGGEVLLYDYLGTSPLFQRFNLDLEHHFMNDETCGWLAIDWVEGPELKTYFRREDEACVRLNTIFQSHSLPALYDLIVYFFHSKMFEPIANWDVRGGEIEGNLDLSLFNGDPYCLKGKVSFSHVQAENRSLELIGEIDHAAANLDLDFSSVNSMNGEFFLEGGRLALEESREIWQGMWDLSNLHTMICLKEGKVESSILRGHFMGMDGALFLDWDSADTLMEMGFQGYSKEIATLFPASFQECFNEAFAQDHFDLKATVYRTGKGLELEGNLLISGQEMHQLAFGCLFGGKEEKSKYISESIPYSFSHSVDSLLEHVVNQFCLSHKRFGWFHAEHFPVEKFLSPFLLRDVRMDLFGRANFEGTFDEKYLVISYDCEDLSIESPHFSLQAACNKLSEEVVAVHYIDLQRWDHVGFLPLKKGNYYQKNRDLLFTNASGVIHFENSNIHIQGIEANWEHLFFQGELDIKIKALDDVDLLITLHYLEGPASDAQTFLTHFSHSIFWEIPFVGEVRSEGDVCSFHYHFIPKAVLQEGFLQGDFQGCLSKPYLECSGHVTYDLQDITLDFNSTPCSFHGIIGKTIDLVGEDFAFRAEKYSGGMKVSECNFRSWEGKGDLKWAEEEIDIQHLAIHSPLGELIFSGLYDREKKVLKGNVDKFQWDFDLSHSMWHPKGGIFGSGTLEWNLIEGVQANLATSFKGLEFGGIHFGDGEDLSCSYSSKFGVSVEGLEVEVPTPEGVEKYKLGRFSYDFDRQKLLFEGFDFSLPPDKLKRVAELAKHLVPTAEIDWVEALKQNEPLEGRVSVEISPDNVWVYLNLHDGTYYLSDKKLELKNFLLLYDPHEVNVWTELLDQDNNYWVHFAADSPTMKHGKLAVSENMLSPEHPEGFDALTVEWERMEDERWSIQSIEGNFHGIHANMHKAAIIPDAFQLEGRVGIDVQRVRPLLKQGKFARFIDTLSLGGGYALEGVLTLPKSDISAFSFSGILSSPEFKIVGVELSSLSSQFDYSPDEVTFTALTIKDWAGRLFLNQAALTRQNEGWALDCDALNLEDVRLSRLRSPWTRWEARDKPFFRSFFVQNFELNHLHGLLNDVDSLEGSGFLKFTNLPKKTFFNSLLLIPTEITARIGLDLTNLIPVRGIVDYTLQEGKIIFNEFKEMFSDGKRSRFYLVEESPAYLDLEGNLSLKLKMKQYNLLMKLAEFFTISIKGTLLHPTYTFTNQFEDD